MFWKAFIYDKDIMLSGKIVVEMVGGMLLSNTKVLVVRETAARQVEEGNSILAIRVTYLKRSKYK